MPNRDTSRSYQTSYNNQGSMSHRDTSMAIKQALDINQALMPHRDTSLAIKQAINRALNVTQGQKRSYETIY